MSVLQHLIPVSHLPWLSVVNTSYSSLAATSRKVLHRSCAAPCNTLRHTSCCLSACASLCQHCPLGRAVCQFKTAAVLPQAGPERPATMAAAAAAAAATTWQPTPQRRPVASLQRRRRLVPAAAPPTAQSQKVMSDAAEKHLGRSPKLRQPRVLQARTGNAALRASSQTEKPAAGAQGLAGRSCPRCRHRACAGKEAPASAAMRRAAPSRPLARAAASSANRSQRGPRQAPGTLRHQ